MNKGRSSSIQQEQQQVTIMHQIKLKASSNDFKMHALDFDKGFIKASMISS
jgi:hypothetical protein